MFSSSDPSLDPRSASVWRTIVPSADGRAVEVIDQRQLPHELVRLRLDTAEVVACAIADMVVRGAPLIGVTAAYGMWLGLLEDSSDESLRSTYTRLARTRPTAVNLRWALDEVSVAVAGIDPADRACVARRRADEIAAADVAICAAIGDHGRPLIERVRREAGPVQILTHCNAGWLAAVAWGTALAPVYKAHQAGIPLHVFVDETRPRNQGASLTAWELAQAGIPHTVIADNAGGHLMQRGEIDLCLVGADRVTGRGDVCNKIGTYLKALAASAHAIPFYVGLPGPTIDWTLDDGLTEIPIEERSGDEVRQMEGLAEDGHRLRVALMPDSTPVRNPAFDVTPARLITALITERGVCAASREGLATLYPDRVG